MTTHWSRACPPTCAVAPATPTSSARYGRSRRRCGHERAVPARPAPPWRRARAKSSASPSPDWRDRPLVRGQGLFAADVNFPRQLVMRVVRSQIARGRILAIDTDAARALPGVIAVWTAADVSEIPPIPFRATKVRGLEPYCQPILATNHVRYAGEPDRGRLRHRRLYRRGRRRPGHRGNRRPARRCWTLPKTRSSSSPA